VRRRVRILRRKEIKGDVILQSNTSMEMEKKIKIILSPQIYDVVRNRELLENEFTTLSYVDPEDLRQRVECQKMVVEPRRYNLGISDLSPEMFALMTSPAANTWKIKIAKERQEREYTQRGIRIFKGEASKQKEIQKKISKRKSKWEKISEIYLSTSLSYSKIAEKTSSTLYQVQNVIKSLRKNHRVPQPAESFHEKNRKLSACHMKFIRDTLENEQTRDKSLRERSALIKQKFPDLQSVSHETVRLYCRRYLHYSFKSVRLTDPNANSYINRKRRKVIVWLMTCCFGDFCEVIFIDECGIGSRALKKKGWSSAERGCERTGHSRGKNISLCAAITREGVISIEFSSSAYNELTFTRFLKETITNLRASGRLREKPLVLFMDNAAFHKAPLCLEYCRMSGVSVLYNAPYSPQLNPIEYFFQDIKSKLASDSDLRM
jgi:hypothetical protein